MRYFKEDDKLASIIHEDYFLLPVLNRLGVRLGFKDKTVKEVCFDKHIDVNFFLIIINAFTNSNYFPKKELLSFSPLLFIDYLRKTHLYYINHLLPEIEWHLNKMYEGFEGTRNDLDILKTFYNKYKDELIKHLDEENDVVFPYVEAIVRAYENNTKIPNEYINYSMVSFEQEHTDVVQKVLDLKNIVIKYLDSSYNDDDCNIFLSAIFQFEKDWSDHARIEDKILFVRVIEIEKQLKNE